MLGFPLFCYFVYLLKAPAVSRSSPAPDKYAYVNLISFFFLEFSIMYKLVLTLLSLILSLTEKIASRASILGSPSSGPVTRLDRSKGTGIQTTMWLDNEEIKHGKRKKKRKEKRKRRKKNKKTRKQGRLALYTFSLNQEQRKRRD